MAIDGAFLGARRGGDETFLRGMLAGLAARREPADTFPLVLADDCPDPLGDPAFPVTRVPRRPGPAHFVGTLPRALRRCGPLDLVVSVTHAPLGFGSPAALVLGDLSFVHRPGDYPRATAMRLRRLVDLQLRRAAGVLVPSEFTRRDVLHTYGLDPRVVHVVPNRVAPAVRPDPAVVAALAARGVVAPFVLYLGNLHPRKNVPRLVRAFRSARLRGYRLVVAGGRWFGGAAEQDAAAGDQSIVFLGRVTDAERTALLAGAHAVAYVSLFEGFGLPPLEAMAYGTPVLTSRVTSLPEVTGGAALLVHPHDDSAVTAGLQRIVSDDALRERLRVAGPAQAALFDDARVGDAALNALQHACSTVGGGRISGT